MAFWGYGCVLIVFVVVCHHGVVGLSFSGHRSDAEILFGGLKRFARQAENIGNISTQDDHVYYKSRFYTPGSDDASQLWFDVQAQEGIEVIPENGISESFRAFDTLRLPFDFQFYGHKINQITITTAGFLYTSPYLHDQIQLTQFIAPLQADFNPSIHDNASVLIYNSTERFTVQWDRVHITNHVENGTFTFQVSLFLNGTIHFAYREIPLLVSEISTVDHPVTVGLADSFYVDVPLRGDVVLRHIYEYSRIQLTPDDLSFSGFVLDPEPSCIPAGTCQECIDASQSTPFECGWCKELSRCSDGVDRFRQEWVNGGCSNSKTNSCAVVSTVGPIITPVGQLIDTLYTGKQAKTTSLIKGSILSAGIISAIAVCAIIIILVVVLIVGCCVALLCYGYRRPNSKIGLFMIEHRPKARSLNKGKGAYNVDSGKVALN